MSYEIYYKKAFIKVPKDSIKEFDTLEDLFVPVLQHGSNNCFDVINNRELPEKNWTNWNWNGKASPKIFCNKGMIEEYAMSFSKPNSYDELPHKSRNRRFDSQLEAVRWFCNGMSRAMTVEQYKEHHNSIWVCDSSNDDFRKWVYKFVATTQELIDAVRNCDPLHCSVEFHSRELRLPRMLRKRKERKQVQGYYTVTMRSDVDRVHYVNALRGSRIKYSRYLMDAKKFETEKAAIKFCDKCSKEFADKYAFGVEYDAAIALI